MGIVIKSGASNNTASVDASGNLQVTLAGSGAGTSDVNVAKINGGTTVASATGIQKVGVVGGAAGVTIDAVLGATKPANSLQVGGNDGTNAYAIPLASGGGSVVVSGAITSITNQVDTNLKQVGGANTSTSASGTQKVGVVGGAAGVTLDSVLGATKPANSLQVGGNDGTNAYAIPLASGGGSVVISGTVTGITNQVDTNLKQVGGANTSTAASGVQKVGVVGNAGAAFDAPVSGTAPANVIYEGLRGSTTVPTAVTDGQIVAARSDKYGNPISILNAPRDLIGTVQLNSSSGSAVSFISAGAANVFNDIITLIITNETTTATIVSLSDNGAGGTVYKFAIAASGGIVINFPTPLPQGTAAVAWDVLNSAAVALDYIAVYAKNK
jgi:hypothetical protein